MKYNMTFSGLELDYEEGNRAAHITSNAAGRYLVTTYDIVDGARVQRVRGGQNQLIKATSACEEWVYRGQEPGRALFAPPPEFEGQQ